MLSRTVKEYAYLGVTGETLGLSYHTNLGIVIIPLHTQTAVFTVGKRVLTTVPPAAAG